MSSSQPERIAYKFTQQIGRQERRIVARFLEKRNPFPPLAFATLPG